VPHVAAQDAGDAANRRDTCFETGMSRGLIRSLLVALLVASGVAQTVHGGSNPNDTTTPPILQRFLSLDSARVTAYRALRHLDARNERMDKTAWMDVWTEADREGGFKYTVVAEGGSGYIRSKVFRASLEKEREMYASGDPSRAALTTDNYVFEDEGTGLDGLSALAVTPRRKDVLLIDGSIFLNPKDGDLVRIEGRLAKAPSFWVQRVQVVRSFQRIAGVRMPIATEAVANIRLAGRATFHMTYEYESVNGQQVGTPEARLARAGTPLQSR